MILYKGLIEHLRADSILATMLSSVHEQIPGSSTVVPYVYVHLQDVERLRTFDGLFSRMRVICYGFSFDLEEITVVSERIKEVLDSFFTEYRERYACVFSYRGYRINCIPRHTFRSALNFEVLFSDKF